MKKIMHFLFLSCLKATELIEKKINFRLSRKEKIQLKMHKTMCKACTNYEKQSYFIEKNISNIEKSSNNNIDIQSLKNAISEKIKNIDTSK